MYVPDLFKLEDPRRIAEVLEHFNFALLVTAVEGGAPVATHLPFMFDAARGPKGTLVAHMARANPHWRDFAALTAAGGAALVAFSGPHRYISPSWYGPGDAVPTWNYVAVHAYGAPRLIEDPDAVRVMLDRLVAVHEAGAPKSWSLAGQDEGFLARMQRGIVAFEIPIDRLEAKAKLSQNKEPPVRQRISAALRGGGDGEAAALAAWMDSLAHPG